MCGIIGIVRRRSRRTPPELTGLVAVLGDVAAGIAAPFGTDDVGRLSAAAESLRSVSVAMSGPPGVAAGLGDASGFEALRVATVAVDDAIAMMDAALDGDALDPATVAAVEAPVLAIRDAAWTLGRDRLRAVDGVADLLGGVEPTVASVEAYTSIHQALSGLDRLEVRGRDSAGIHVIVHGHALDLTDPATADRVAARAADPLFRTGSVRVGDHSVAFVYKAAAEIGELGDNTAVLRAAIRADQLLTDALATPDAAVTVLGHTRWASVGIISEANAHPLESSRRDDPAAPYVAAALNGDVDNHLELAIEHGLQFADGITTDAKVIPALVANGIVSGQGLDDSFRSTVSSFDGSVAIAATSDARPDTLHLALRGSGQALYVGLGEDQFIVASEPYGVIEETARYLRLDGETPSNPDNPTASRGQMVVLAADGAGTIDGLTRVSYDGTVLPVTDGEIVTAEITTRDIDRGDHPHFLLKEVSEAPSSFRKTLRGRLVGADDDLRVELTDDTLPPELRARLRGGGITRVSVIGQGTAAVAGQGVADAIRTELAGLDVMVEALPATELSGFEMRSDMSDTLVVAISQSGTTTDTNRTVDLVRARGGTVVAIVNRRNSDLVDKSDGVLYTSDGRDVEMSVASTKAFYSQIAAGLLLACALADAMRPHPTARERQARQRLLGAVRGLPDALTETLLLREHIGRIAHRIAPGRRYWALVGNGRNQVAAREVRIKLSELCYKSIACDTTEDKKHIDLSSEPMIIVCAAGLSGSTLDDVVKEVAIYGAHKAAPVVIGPDDERFVAVADVIALPDVEPRVAFVLAAMAGHLFGYEAALAIDALAQPLRQSRSLVEATLDAEPGLLGDELLTRVVDGLREHASVFFGRLRAGDYDGTLEASTATRLASMYRYAVGVIPLDAYQVDHGEIGTPAVVVEELMRATSAAIDELTRPIDAIKHQAKTVTVGISRGDEALVQVPLVAAVLEAGSPRDQLSYASLRTLAELDPAIKEVVGFTRYSIDGDAATDDARISILDRGGISAGLRSRVDHDPVLRGTKHRVAFDQDVHVTQGRRDGRSIVLVPEVKDRQTIGLTIMHVEFADRLPAAVAAGVLRGYDRRLSRLRDAVTETEPDFDERVLAEVPLLDLLVDPVAELADRWRDR
jgi:glucosamine--fructose-6-phosphate aminotransferase (isomerizing)